MSAIWGVVNLNKEDNIDLSQYALLLKESYKTFRIDKSESVLENDYAIGCEHQFLTQESFFEKLPILADNMIFTADCVLDNRNQLIEELSAKKDSPDGELLKIAYSKWGEDFGNHVLGAFSFAIYNTDAQELTLVSDHLGNRSLFYTLKDGLLFFSTAIMPLAKAINAVPSEKWLAGCLCNTSADMMVFPELTPFDSIYQLPNATILSISNSTIHDNSNSALLTPYTYWNPYTIKPKKMTQAEAKSFFVSTLKTAVSDILRSPAETGCTLSSGLDSSSIACLAAPILKESGKSLFSYTSLPLPDYASSDDYAIADETPGVTAICDKYDNIKPNFLPCEGMDAFSSLEEMVPVIGYPMKSGHNLTWLTEIYKKAAKQNCKLMLKGQYGNSTISYGNALGTVFQLISSGKIGTARHIAGGFCQRYHIPKKNFFKQFLYEFIHLGNAESLDESGILISRKLLSDYGIEKQLTYIQRHCGGSMMDSRKKRIAFIQDPTALQQLGMFDTVMGLYNGILIRDPSKDKRVVEMVLSLPLESMMAGSVERGTVRTYMKGIVPDSILDDIWHRGLQSADYVHRTQLLWNKNKDKILSECVIKDNNNYVDKEKCINIINSFSAANAEDLEIAGLRALNVLYSECIFIDSFN